MLLISTMRNSTIIAVPVSAVPVSAEPVGRWRRVDGAVPVGAVPVSAVSTVTRPMGSDSDLVG